MGKWDNIVRKGLLTPWIRTTSSMVRCSMAPVTVCYTHACMCALAHTRALPYAGDRVTDRQLLNSDKSSKPPAVNKREHENPIVTPLSDVRMHALKTFFIGQLLSSYFGLKVRKPQPPRCSLRLRGTMCSCCIEERQYE